MRLLRHGSAPRSCLHVAQTASILAITPLRGIPSFLAAALLALCAAAVSAQVPEPADDAESFGAHFLEVFAKKDFETLRTFFAPGATVGAVWIEETTVPKVSPVGEWIESAAKDVAAVEWETFEVVESTALSFDHGTVVSVLFHSVGRLGKHTFTNDGIDTYLLRRIDGEWKIFHYSYLEKLEMQPPDAGG